MVLLYGDRCLNTMWFSGGGARKGVRPYAASHRFALKSKWITWSSMST
jgi:hypothetical protein